MAGVMYENEVGNGIWNQVHEPMDVYTGWYLSAWVFKNTRVDPYCDDNDLLAVHFFFFLHYHRQVSLISFTSFQHFKF